MRNSMVAAGALALLTLATLPNIAAAHSPSAAQRSAPGHLMPVYAGKSSRSFVPASAPTESLRAGTSTVLAKNSTIQVTYHGFTTAAKAAFQAAVNVWQSILVSDQVIHVDASWTGLGQYSGILGEAGPTNYYLDNDNYWYPNALEEARCHCNRNGTGADITARFNSQFPYWYRGTDGKAPSGKWDLETVVLHELGHGLGFFSSFDVSGGLGYWGATYFGHNHPLRFDALEYDAASGGNQLIDSYPDGVSGSGPLKTALTSGHVYLYGTQLLSTLGHGAKLYAPSPWQSGSSNSHLDEAAFAPGTINALMTPVLNDGEVIHSPGPATIAIFQDIGWNVAGSTTAPDAPTAVTATAGDASADVAWSPPASNGGSPIAAYTVTSAPDGHTCATTGALGCTVSGLTNGTEYQFKVTATNSVGTGPSSVPSNAVVPHASSSDSTAPTVNVPTVNFVAPQAMTSTVKVDVDWSATDDSGIAGYELQRRDGAGSWTAVPLTSPTATTARITVTRGSNTAFRVRATDGVGNVGPWSTTTAASTSTVSETASSIVYSGSWTRSALTGSAGGYVKWSSTTNDTATLHFSGTSVAFVSTLSPGRGIAEISVDGTVVATVDLRAATKKAKQVVWATDSPLSPGTHTVTVRVTGASTGTSDRVDVDAFIVWP